MRCSAQLDVLLDEVVGSDMKGQKDAVQALRKLLEQTAPGSTSSVFTNKQSLIRILHLNDYVLDKAFVHCILSLSKWLKHDIFPKVVWPPVAPKDLFEALKRKADKHAEEASSSSLPAMSSKSTFQNAKEEPN